MSIEPLMSSVGQKAKGKGNGSVASPQKFLVKILRGLKWLYLTEDGESPKQSEAKDFGTLAEARVQSQIFLRQPDIDGTEVEMVTK